MKKCLFIIALFGILSGELFAQSEVNVFLIARTTGIKILADGDTVTVFGFAQDLGEQPSVPGPTIYANEGDSVHIDLWNVSQGAPHTIHLHGLDVNQQNDGVPHLSFDIGHMEHGYYHFKAPHAGTYLYHCHVASTIHVQAGMYGLVIIKAAGDSNVTWAGGYPFDKEFNYLFSEIDTLWHSKSTLDHPHGTDPNPIMIPVYDPGHFLINGLEDDQLIGTEMRIDKNVNVLLRLANIGFYANKLIFPENLNVRIIASDGRPLPAEISSDTLIIYPGERYQVLINASAYEEDSIQVLYTDLNTGNTKGEQFIGYEITDLSSSKDVPLGSLIVYPNPFSASIYIDQGEKVIDKLELLDLKGSSLNVERNGNQVMVPQDLFPGIYFLKVYSGDQIYVIKLIKI